MLPKEARLRSWAVSKIVSVYAKHGFTQIETPIIENLEWLTGGVGGENEKLLFRILKRGDKLDLESAKSEDDVSDLALRFDLTVPLSRYYANNEANLPTPFKAIQIGPVFRAERPQKGRFRQFTQCDIDIIGEPGIMGEMELIGASSEALLSLGLKNFNIKLNDRRALEALGGHCGFEKSQWDSLYVSLDKLDKIGVEGISKELYNKSFLPAAIDRLAELTSSLQTGRDPIDFYDEIGVDSEVVDNLVSLRSLAVSLGAGGFECTLDPTIVRGMGYYTGTVFEVSYPGWNSSIAGGGRYDGMLERYGKRSPAVGFSLGFERIMGILSEEDLFRGQPGRYVTVLFSDEENMSEVYRFASSWRDGGYSVTLRRRRAKIGNQLKRLEAEADGMRVPGDFHGVIVFGEDSEPREL